MEFLGPSYDMRFKTGGEWRQVKEIYTKVNGVWRLVPTVNFKTGGVWKQLTK